MKVLKFSAIWCVDCIVMRPMWEEIEKLFPNLKIENIDADEFPEKLKNYEVKDIPTFIFFNQDGNEISRLKGLQNKEKIIELIKNNY
jgi:thiol-disulfide isomerase/thioredoxin